MILGTKNVMKELDNVQSTYNNIEKGLIPYPIDSFKDHLPFFGIFKIDI